jgi:hypothetical protein
LCVKFASSCWIHGARPDRVALPSARRRLLYLFST